MRLGWLFLLGWALCKASSQDSFSLVTPDLDHEKLLLNSITVDELRARTQPFQVISVVGPFNSGKSFLLNQLRESSAFPVGPLVTPTSTVQLTSYSSGSLGHVCVNERARLSSSRQRRIFLQRGSRDLRCKAVCHHRPALLRAALQ